MKQPATTKVGLIEIPVEVQERMYAIRDELDQLDVERHKIYAREEELHDEALKLWRKYPTVYLRRPKS